jgi:hypothetical protein
MHHSSEWLAETLLPLSLSSCGSNRIGVSVISVDCDATKGKRCDRNRRAHQV